MDLNKVKNEKLSEIDSMLVNVSALDKLFIEQHDINPNKLISEAIYELRQQVNGFVKQETQISTQEKEEKPTRPQYKFLHIKKPSMPFSNAVKHWTEEEEQKLIELYRNGESPEVIALSLNRTPAAVRTKLRDLKRAYSTIESYTKENSTKKKKYKRLYGSTNWTKAEQEFMLESLKKGKSKKYIANKLGRSIASIHTRLWRLNNGKKIGLID